MSGGDEEETYLVSGGGDILSVWRRQCLEEETYLVSGGGDILSVWRRHT